MLKKGALVLSVWCWLNVIPAAVSLYFIFAGEHAPGLRLRFTSEEISGIEDRALATVDGLAAMLNMLIAVYCVTFFFVVRKSLLKGDRWSFFVLSVGMLLVQIVGYISDHVFFLGRSVLALHVSSILLVVGFGLCAKDLFPNVVEPAGMRRRSEKTE